MENIRKGLMYRERNELLGTVSPLRIKLGVNRPKFVLTEMNDLILNFDESQTALYMFILQTGGVRLAEMQDLEDNLKECYRLVKNGNILQRELDSTVSYWVNPENPEVLTQKISKINKKLKVLLGETLANPYLVTNQKGTYKIKLPMNNVEIL
jgi:hypothetical protein